LNASSRASGRRSRRGAAAPRRARWVAVEGSSFGAEGSPFTGPRRGSRKGVPDSGASLVGALEEGAQRAPARSARWWKAPGPKPSSRGRGKVSVAVWMPGYDPPRRVARRRRRVSGRVKRVAFGLRSGHGTGSAFRRRAATRGANTANRASRDASWLRPRGELGARRLGSSEGASALERGRGDRST
jgi:hypothetical protein